LPFAVERCTRVVLRGGRQPVDISRDAGTRKSLFQKETFWDRLLAVICAGPPRYATYSYRERSDRYTRELVHAEVEAVRAAAESVKFSTLKDQIRIAGFNLVEAYVTR
ncbi:MAG TPA: hypothetical protein VGG67_14275, partial [Steroidobacteraceae bacterium]